jgi:hypothetical protein
MECLASNVHVMDWHFPLKKVGNVTYSCGTYNAGLITPTKETMQKAMWLVAYNYANNVQGANEQHANVIVDGFHWKEASFQGYLEFDREIRRLQNIGKRSRNLEVSTL